MTMTPAHSERVSTYAEAALAILDATLKAEFHGNPYDSIGLAARLIRDALNDRSNQEADHE